MKSDFNFRDIKLSPSILEVQRSQINNLETSNLRNALVHNNWIPSLDEGHFKSVRANSLHYSNKMVESLREDDLEAIITCPHCGETYRTYINDFVSSWEDDGEDGVGICPFCEEEFYVMESEPEIIEKRPFVESTENPSRASRFLGRLVSDCNYILGPYEGTKGSLKHLWAKDVDEQIYYMRRFKKEMEENGEEPSITDADIERYERELKKIEMKESIGNHKHMSQESIKLENFNKNGMQNDVIDGNCMAEKKR